MRVVFVFKVSSGLQKNEKCFVPHLLVRVRLLANFLLKKNFTGSGITCFRVSCVRFIPA